MMETKKTWRSVEIPYYSQGAIRRSVKFRMFLIDHYIKFESSAVYHGTLDFVHFEILCNEQEAKKINKALDEIVWCGSI